MASTPTTKSQVQAYRFVLRRMQSALVRRDAVMLHDPMRNHSRATAVGVLLGIVGLLGFLVFGFFKPNPILDDKTQIAVSKETGQVYVVDRNPQRLIPMTNLASARLFWYSRTNPDKGTTGGGDAPGGTAGTQPEAAGGAPKLISESALSKWARGRLTGIPDAPDVLPAKSEQRIGAEWSVCDTLELDSGRDDQAIGNKIKTTVIAGVSKGNPELAADQSMVVQEQTGAKRAYLIYRKPDSRTDLNTSTVKAEIDLKDNAIKTALNLGDVKLPRNISNGLLNVIPSVGKLTPPKIDGQGTPATYLKGNFKVGDVVEVKRTGADVESMVVLKDGLQKISSAVGDILRAAYANNKKPEEISLNDVSQQTNPSQPLDLKDYPDKVPTALFAVGNNVVLCAGWRADNFGDANTKAEHTAVTIGAALPGGKMTAVELNQKGALGEIIDEFMITPGKAAVVRGSQNKNDFGSGPMQIVTGRGVRYHIPDAGTATALGLDDPKNYPPAPESILRLLPQGPQLNRNDATRSFDSIDAKGDVASTGTDAGAGTK